MTQVTDPGLSEADTCANLIDPAIRKCGWTEDMIRREETAGSIEIIGGKARRRSRGQVDYTLRLKVAAEAQPVAIALIEAKKSSLPPGHGLDQGKAYAHCKRLNVPFVFSSNGHQFVEYDRFTGLTRAPRPMAEFPSPDLRQRYGRHMGSPENHFSHVVIDECHRSAFGKWSQVLTRNFKAVQVVGLTATPRTLKTGKKTKEAEQDAQISADNRKYFGEPVYEYDMAQAMEDGHLALCEIQKGRVNLDNAGVEDAVVIRR